MAFNNSSYDLLSELSNVKVDFRCLLKVIRKWEEPQNQHMGVRLHLLLSDSKGDRIEAIVEKYLIPEFHKKLEIGGVYIISRFSVLDSNFYFPPSKLNNLIMLFQSSTVEPVLCADFTESLFRFTSFPVLKYGHHVEGISLFDIIGAVVDLRHEICSDDGNPMMVLLLEDNDFNRIPLFLRGHCYRLFKNFYNVGWVGENDLIVVLQLCCTEMINGDIFLSTKDSVTNIILDQELEEIVKFKEGLLEHVSISVNRGFELDTYAKKMTRDQLLSPNVDIMDLSDMRTSYTRESFWVYGVVQEILWHHGWVITKCKHCPIDESAMPSKILCKFCEEYIGCNAKYKLRLRIVDGLDFIDLILNDDTAAELIGRAARFVVKDSISEDGNSLMNPDDIQKLLGTEHFFKVLCHEQLPVYTTLEAYVVEKICNDEDLLLNYKSTKTLFHLPTSTDDSDEVYGTPYCVKRRRTADSPEVSLRRSGGSSSSKKVLGDVIHID